MTDVATGVDAIVVAAGASTRMGGTDKLTAVIGGRPLLAWTLAALSASRIVERIVLVVPHERAASWSTAGWLPATVRSVVPGGALRQDSVAAGLSALASLGADDDRVVLVHDGARPCVPPRLVEEVAAAAVEHGAAIPVLPVAETLKRLDGDVVGGTVDRGGLVAAQTPQAARLGLLRHALATIRVGDGDEPRFTDEAALLEACSIRVHAIPGHPDNLKVTIPADLDRAAALLVPADLRLGFGHDGHPFGPGEPLVLGGIPIDGAPRLHGHSDGDVVLHAVADALLGAASLGDLGRLFPADDRTPRGVASAGLLTTVVDRLAAAGLRPAGVDVTVLAARPRLGTRLDDMRARIADLLGLDPGRVSVKASTGNLDGMEGGGRGISARAVAVVERTR